MKNERSVCLNPLEQKTKSLRLRKPAASPPNYQRFQELTPLSLPQAHLPPSTALTRMYLRSLRAAEMAAWEMTGGDYLRSSFAA